MFFFFVFPPRLKKEGTLVLVRVVVVCESYVHLGRAAMQAALLASYLTYLVQSCVTDLIVKVAEKSTVLIS